MSDDPQDQERAQELTPEESAELVHARYLGTTVISMPVLRERPRCCEEDRLPESGPLDDEKAAELGVPPGTYREALVLPDDVFLLDRGSAEGREDFEVIAEHHASPKRKRSAPAEREGTQVLDQGETSEPEADGASSQES